MSSIGCGKTILSEPRGYVVFQSFELWEPFDNLKDGLFLTGSGSESAEAQVERRTATNLRCAGFNRRVVLVSRTGFWWVPFLSLFAR